MCRELEVLANSASKTMVAWKQQFLLAYKESEVFLTSPTAKANDWDI